MLYLLLFFLICRPRRQRITTNSDFLVDNPIYKTCNSTTSLVNSENGVRSNKLELRSVGGSSDSILNEPEPSAPPPSGNKLSAAENPQYGSSPQYHPPPSHKPPRYIKVNPGEEPTYEIIKNANTETPNGSKTLPSNRSTTGDPIYSTPSPVLKRGEPKTLPLYESAMDVPVAMGKDGVYAKLNHESKTSSVPLPST